MGHNRGNGFDTQRWYEATMDRRTREALHRRIEEYERDHEDDSSGALLDAIRKRAAELGYVPYPAECLGARMIVERFGSWARAVKLAGLPSPRGPRRLNETRLYREEYRRQQKLHRAERERKRADRRAASRGRDK